MGSCLSQPLQKVPNPSSGSNPNHAYSGKTSRSSYGHSSHSTNSKSAKVSKSKKKEAEGSGNNSNGPPIVITTQSLSSNDDQCAEQTRPYFSFTSFMIQNENPQIFEWIFEREIAKGSLSQIYLVKHSETGEIFAAKVYNNAVLHRQTLGNEDPPYVCVFREVEVLSKLFHPSVLTVLEVIEDVPTNSSILVVPYAAQGIFTENRGDMTIQNVMVCFYQICEALRYVHAMGFVHRNVRPESILMFDDFYFVLSDFKLATKIFNFDGNNSEGAAAGTSEQRSSFYRKVNERHSITPSNSINTKKSNKTSNNQGDNHEMKKHSKSYASFSVSGLSESSNNHLNNHTNNDSNNNSNKDSNNNSNKNSNHNFNKDSNHNSNKDSNNNSNKNSNNNSNKDSNHNSNKDSNHNFNKDSYNNSNKDSKKNVENLNTENYVSNDVKIDIENRDDNIENQIVNNRKMKKESNPDSNSNTRRSTSKLKREYSRSSQSRNLGFPPNCGGYGNLKNSNVNKDFLMLNDVKGTLAYLSPEECSGKPFDGRLSDTWSYGVSLYYALFGRLPFNLSEKSNLTVAGVSKVLETETLDFPKDLDMLHEGIPALLTGLLERDPSKRMTLDEASNSDVFSEAREITRINNESKTLSSLMLNVSETSG